VNLTLVWSVAFAYIARYHNARLLLQEQCEEEFGGQLKPEMQGELSHIIGKVFKNIAKKKVFVPGSFESAT
jgi:hypothetical protein